MTLKSALSKTGVTVQGYRINSLSSVQKHPLMRGVAHRVRSSRRGAAGHGVGGKRRGTSVIARVFPIKSVINSKLEGRSGM